MKRVFALALLLVGVTVVIGAQAPGRGPQGPSPRPLVGETLPIGGDIARTIHFYHDVLGLQCRSGDPRARLGWYDTRPFLEDMYAVTGGQLRNVTFLVPGSPLFVAGEEMQIEPIEFNRAKGKPLNLNPQDPRGVADDLSRHGHRETRRLPETGWGEGGDLGRGPGRD